MSCPLKGCMNLNFDSLHKRLAKLEERLQTLVEGSTARLLAPGGLLRELPHELVEHMQADLRPQPDGVMLAPNVFTLYVHPKQAQDLALMQSQLDAMMADLENAGYEAGFSFLVPPRWYLIADPDLPVHQFRLAARISQEQLSKTSDTPVIDEALLPASPPPGAFLIVDGTQTFLLTKTVINLGRRPDNHIVITDNRVSRVHAQIRLINGRYVIFDLDSTGGTRLNGKPVHQAILSPGDVLDIAGVPMIYGEEFHNLEETQKIDLTDET